MLKEYESIYNDKMIRGTYVGTRKNLGYITGNTYDLWFWYIGDKPYIMRDDFAGRLPYDSLDELKEEWVILSGDVTKP